MLKVPHNELRYIPAQIGVLERAMLVAYYMRAKLGYDSLTPYRSKVEPPPDHSASDTFWGDFKTRAVPKLADGLEQFEHYGSQVDFELRIHGRYGREWNRAVAPKLEPLDNVLIGEYTEGFIRTGSFHVIVAAWRVDELVYSRFDLSLLDPQLFPPKRASSEES